MVAINEMPMAGRKREVHRVRKTVVWTALPAIPDLTTLFRGLYMCREFRAASRSSPIRVCCLNELADGRV